MPRDCNIMSCGSNSSSTRKPAALFWNIEVLFVKRPDSLQGCIILKKFRVQMWLRTHGSGRFRNENALKEVLRISASDAPGRTAAPGINRAVWTSLGGALLQQRVWRSGSDFVQARAKSTSSICAAPGPLPRNVPPLSPPPPTQTARRASTCGVACCSGF
jgi:hypothetical protein